MSEQERFLSRWSRRKREVAKEEALPQKAESAETSAPEAAKDQQPAPFDPASLPPIDSINVATDIRGFLAENVPAALKHAALRRAWVADPTIRDFVGLAENDWDFTKPETIPGFGALDPEFDVAGMVRRVFGEGPPAESQVPVPSLPADDTAQLDGNIPEDVARVEAADEPPPGAVTAEPEIVHRGESAALQTDMTHSQDEPRGRRRLHGGALPQEFPVTRRDS